MSQYVEECNRKPMGLYHPSFEHDNCGIGAVVNIKGNKSHETVKHALEIVANLEHRAGKDGEGKQEMVLVSSYRSLINSLRKYPVRWVLNWATKENMA